MNISGVSNPWVTATSAASSAPNSAWVNNLSTASQQALVSPVINILSAAPTITFQHRFSTESGFDGGRLEISINGGPWTNITTAGGSFSMGGYNGSVLSAPAWTGSSPGYPAFAPVAANLPAAATGQPIQLRWWMRSDGSTGGAGWWVDSIVVTDEVCVGTQAGAAGKDLSLWR